MGSDLYELFGLFIDIKVFDAKEFGEAIRKRRKQKGYILRDISDITGFSMSFLSDLERGKTTAELGKALYIANVLGMDVILKNRGENENY